MALGLGYAAAQDAGGTAIAGGAVLVLHALFRTIRPLRYYRESLTSLLMVLAEVLLTLAVVVASGYWRSPYVFCLVSAVVAAGFARGFGFAIRTSVTASLAVAIPFHLRPAGGDIDLSLQWGGELLLVALVAGYARRLFGEAEERTSLALRRMDALTEANQLLSQLHQVAQTLPASLDLDEVLTSTVDQVRQLVAADTVVVLLWDRSAVSWRVGAAEGVRLPRMLTQGELPQAVQRAVDSETAVLEPSLDGGSNAGLGSRSVLGAYVPLRTREQVVGVLAAECVPGGSLGERELGLLSAIADQAALAIDNARWFGRLRTVGADEERTRIARDLHDRVGQSLAYLAFELDRIRRRPESDAVAQELDRLRQDVRRVVGEVRDTLYDLRTDVTEDQGLVPTLEEYLDRVRERTDAEVAFDHRAAERLPLLVEREVWRIAQEAVTNAQRHAEASRIDVRWVVEEGQALLEVRDDGRGLPAGLPGEGSYGIVGMRERADAIGASLEVTPGSPAGTVVRCRLERV